MPLSSAAESAAEPARQAYHRCGVPLFNYR
jgi:hypothetical protein